MAVSVPGSGASGSDQFYLGGKGWGSDMLQRIPAVQQQNGRLFVDRR